MTRKQLVTLWFAVLVVGAVLSFLCIHRHWNFGSSEDLAMFDQMLWNLREGRDLMVSFSGGARLQFMHHFFGEHFSPVLWLLAAPAGLTSGPEALLVMQSFAFALAAIPAAALAASLLGSGTAGLTAGLLWLTMPGMWQGVLYDFHMEAFEALFLFSFCHAFLKNRGLMWLWALLYLSCKEDAGIYLGLLAIVGGCMTGRPAKGLAITMLSFAYVALAVTWIMPNYSPSGHLLMASRLPRADSWDEFIATASNVLLHGPKWTAFLLHLAPFLGLPLFGGPLMLPVAASAGLMWLSTDDRQALMQLHYPLTIYPLLFVAALGVAAWIQKRCRLAGRWKFAVIVLLLLGVVGGWKIHRKNFRHDLKAGQRPVTEQRHHARELLRSIPDEGSLATTLYLSPQVSRRQHLSLLTHLGIYADWFVLPLNTQRIHPLSAQALVRLLDFATSTSSPYGVWGGVPGEIVILKLGWSHERNEEFRFLH